MYTQNHNQKPLSATDRLSQLNKSYENYGKCDSLISQTHTNMYNTLCIQYTSANGRILWMRNRESIKNERTLRTLVFLICIANLGRFTPTILLALIVCTQKSNGIKSIAKNKIFFAYQLQFYIYINIGTSYMSLKHTKISRIGTVYVFRLISTFVVVRRKWEGRKKKKHNFM